LKGGGGEWIEGSRAKIEKLLEIEIEGNYDVEHSAQAEFFAGKKTDKKDFS